MVPRAAMESKRSNVTREILEWLKENLFSPWYNIIISIVSLAILYVILKGVLTWVLYGAKWGVVAANLRLFAVGPYPAEQIWRVWLALGLALALGGMSWGVWGGKTLNALAIAIIFAAVFLWAPLTPASTRNWLLVLAIFVLASLIAERVRPLRSLLQKILPLAWVGAFAVTLVLLRGFKHSTTMPLVETSLWGGLLLTILLAVVAIVVSFPIGVLLALGRRSQLPIVKLFSILYIELIRGVPLITVLFMAQIMLPLFLPPNIRVDKVLRAMTGMTLFAAAYLAENVRGGLQSIPKGQYEAAEALGLNYYQTIRYITLPQALRAVIPAIVGQFIALFKDTSLVAIVGLLDLLNIALSVIAQPEWIGLQREVFAFIAVIYWVFCYAMSYASRRLEVKLGVGVR